MKKEKRESEEKKEDEEENAGFPKMTEKAQFGGDDVHLVMSASLPKIENVFTVM